MIASLMMASCVGAAGPEGPAGTAGAQGEMGSQGAMGAQGPKGDVGATPYLLATGALKLGALVDGTGIGNGTVYNLTKAATGSYVITFPAINLTMAPHPLLVTTNSCCSGTGPNIAVENYTSLAPLTWTVKTYNTAGTLEDHDFSFMLVAGGV
jgi:hypothetical protein